VTGVQTCALPICERICPDATLPPPVYTVESQALASTTLGVENYVSIVFDDDYDAAYDLDTQTYPGTTEHTWYYDSFTVEVLTVTNWGLLSATQLRARVLVAIVTGNGGGAIQPSDISQFIPAKTHPIATQPSTITGVTIVQVYSSTPINAANDAELVYTTGPAALAYKAPNDSVGTPVTITETGQYTLKSNTLTYWIIVDVVLPSLPVVGATETIPIVALYGRQFPIYSARDVAHRDMVGSGQVSLTNPHGLTYNDIGGSSSVITGNHLYHKNGINANADTGQLACTLSPPFSISVGNPGGDLNSFMIDGTSRETLNGITAGSSGSVTFLPTPGGDPDGYYMIYVDEEGNLQKISVANTAITSLNNVGLVDVHILTAGTLQISYDSTNVALSLNVRAAGDGAKVYLRKDAPTGFYKLYGISTSEWVIVYVSGTVSGTPWSATCSKAESDHPDRTALKLCMVSWFSNILAITYDIREYRTADIKDLFYEEHDASGHHSKILQQALGVAVSAGPALNVRALDSYAVSASAAAKAGYFSAGTAAAVYAVASASAVVAAASNTAVYAVVSTACAVYGAAVSIAGSFTAVDSALVAQVAANTAGYVYGAVLSATNSDASQMVKALSVQGGSSGAVAGAVVGQVSDSFATAVIGFAAAPTGGARGIAGYATGSTYATGVVGGGYLQGGVASNSKFIGVYGNGGYGVYGLGNSVGVWAVGSATGLDATGSA